MDQKLSKDMKKQGHVTSRKARNKKLSSEKSLAESPKKGRFTEPSSKKLDGEKFLAKAKLTHIKEYNEFSIDTRIDPFEDGTEVLYDGDVCYTRDPEWDEECGEYHYNLDCADFTHYGVYHGKLKLNK
jgi:hypothetical protein